MPYAVLMDRGVVRLSGETVRDFLQGLVTCDVRNLSAETPAFGALLTPQGKILFDFLMFADGDAILLDCARDQVEALVKRLKFYRLRAKIEIEDISADSMVLAGWGDDAVSPGTSDPRLAALGRREIAQNVLETSAHMRDWDAHRIRLGVPEGGKDYGFGDAFPHEAELDQLGGVDFKKGCFVGQEVVARMEHRGTARSRIVPVRGEAALPAFGAAIEADGVAIGSMGSSAGQDGLAMVRLDRAADALSLGAALTAAGTPIALVQPVWARFAVPGAGQAA